LADSHAADGLRGLLRCAAAGPLASGLTIDKWQWPS
jgi:hypothetical protein